MTTNRVLSLIAMAFGGGLLLWLIPANVVNTGGLVMNPALFPDIAAWLLIGLGAVQFFSDPPTPEPPSPRAFLRFALVAALTLGALIAMPRVGYIPAGAALMAVLALVVHERRITWLAVLIAGMPCGIWAMFELVLKRPLP